MRNSPALADSALVRRTSLAAAAALAALALAGCGDDDTSLAEDPATTAQTSLTATPTTSAPASPTETPTPTGTTSAPAKDTLITLDQPADGATVSGSFQASGKANSPEANVPWRIEDASGTKVLDGHFTAEGWMDKLYPYAGTVDVSSLAPGSYTFVVSIDDESDGEGKKPQQVSHSITVQ